MLKKKYFCHISVFFQGRGGGDDHKKPPLFSVFFFFLSFVSCQGSTVFLNVLMDAGDWGFGMVLFFLLCSVHFFFFSPHEGGNRNKAF